MPAATVDFTTYADSVFSVLDDLDAKPVLARQSHILLKPNLVNASPHPVTTHVACCRAVIDYIRQCSPAHIVIAEGCGDGALDTHSVFASLGYAAFGREYGIQLIDLNVAPAKQLRSRDCPLWPEMFLPEIMLSHFIISLPVLKAHSLAGLTGALKNMMGFLPPEHYGATPGGWKKAAFHRHLHQSILELNRYRTPDLSILDASVGLCDFHLGGMHCQPPPAKIVAGFDPVAVDRTAAALLDMDWQAIDHLQDADAAKKSVYVTP